MQKRCTITVTGRSIPFIKRGVLRDLQTALQMPEYSELSKSVDKYNIHERMFRLKNGSVIEFPVFTNEQDARGGKRDYLFINEADSIPYPIAHQLIIRTTENIFYDYNPSVPFWVHDKIIPRSDSQLIISDHRHNQFLTPEKHAEIENHPDDEWWRVYARGLTGNITSLCFPNWKPIHGNDWRKDVREVVFGGDFGFTSSKTAIVKIHILSNTEVVIEECFYKPESDDQIMYEVLKQWGGDENTCSYFDHNSTDKGARPQQYVQLLRQRGIAAYLAIKAGKSQQIQKIRGVQVWYTEGSTNIAAERSRYKFKTIHTSTGDEVQTNVIDEASPNHLMDAIQYGVYTHFTRNSLWI